MSSLDHAISQLYQEFASIPRPRHIEACPCCLPEEVIDVLLKTPKVSEIPEPFLYPYAKHIFGTVGSEKDFLYFLPRILELAASDQDGMVDVEIIGRGIGLCDLKAWTSKQHEALHNLYRIVIRRLMNPDHHNQIDSWMCAISLGKSPVKAFLNSISQHESAILDYFNFNANRLPQRKLANPFWKLPNTGHDEIVNWFYSDLVKEIVLRNYGFRYS